MHAPILSDHSMLSFLPAAKGETRKQEVENYGLTPILELSIPRPLDEPAGSTSATL
jgi:hypothetical protein